MSTIQQLRDLVEEKWLDIQVDLIARKLSWNFSWGSKTVKVDTPECKGNMPIIKPLDELYETLKALGYVNKIDRKECKHPRLTSKPEFANGVPYLNNIAKEMYEKLVSEGFYEGIRHLGDLGS